MSFRLKYTKLLCLKSIFVLLISACANGHPTAGQGEIPPPDSMEIKVGAARLDTYLPLLKDRSVAIVGNQTSLVDDRHLLDTLLSLGVRVKKVFSPEHGFRGDADAGAHVSTGKDPGTGLPIVSLYGKNKKPTVEQMKGLDVLVFDIQDVGVRFYTYISTLHYVMEACAENKVKLIVLDRPNPNGHYVDGPILEKEFTSFVGMHPIPIVHGMTIGEYAQMINGEQWLPNQLQCDLEVITCLNYTHETAYGLPVPPSPNLRSDLAVQLYPSLCLLEATDVTIGRGTEGPFERYGHPDFPDSLPFSFTPKPGAGSSDPKHKGELCHGYLLNQEEYWHMTGLDLQPLLNSYRLLNGDLFRGQNNRMFFLLCGTDKLLQQIKNGSSEEKIKESWQPGLETFRKTREKYLLYF